LGTVVLDHQLFIDHFPEVDTKIEASNSRLQIGGPVPTALVLLSRLGHDCSFAGLWGDDHLGKVIEEDFQRESVKYFAECRQPGLETGVAHVWVEQSTGSRTIVCRRVIENDDQLAGLSNSLPETGAVHLDGWPARSAIAHAQAAKEKGLTVFLDTGSPKGRTDELLALVDVVNTPRRFLIQYFEDDNIEQGARQLLDFGPRIITITNGDQGAWLFTRSESHYLPAYPVNSVDTTGAGDVFSGALIHAVLEEWPAEQILKFASAAAAIKCQKQGNREALPTLPEIDQLIASHR